MDERIITVQLSNNSKYLALSLQPGVVIILKILSSKSFQLFNLDFAIKLKNEEDKSEISHLRWSFEDNYLAVAHFNCNINIWNFKT